MRRGGRRGQVAPGVRGGALPPHPGLAGPGERFGVLRQGDPYFPVIDLLKRYAHVEDHDDTRTVRARVTGQVLTLDERLQDAILPSWRSWRLYQMTVPSGNSIHRSGVNAPSRRSSVCCAQARCSRCCWSLRTCTGLAETQALLDTLIDSLPTALASMCQLPPGTSTAGAEDLLRSSASIRCRQRAPTPCCRRCWGRPNLAPLKQLLIERTAGNPFFLEETVRTLVETQVLVGAPGLPSGPGLPTIQVPATVQAVLAAASTACPWSQTPAPDGGDHWP